MQAFHTHSLRNIRKTLGYLKIKSLALKTKANLRRERKFSATDMLLSFWQLNSFGLFSYDDWALQISLINGETVSGQAVCKRMSLNLVNLLKELLNKSFKQKHNSVFDPDLFKSFVNVYIQDATHFSLPKFLASTFPGSYSRYGEVATAKIQATFSLKKGIFSDFKLFSFRDNDQKDSPRIVEQLKSGDLLIRDLGYFVTKVFNQIINKGAYFLSRYRYGSIFFDIESGIKIDLYKLLKTKENVDMVVTMGVNKKLTCRLVAVCLPKHIAEQRRRKAKLNRNKKSNHSKEYLEMLGYSIYITNVSQEVWSVEQVAKAYNARWYIEILFKGWKSKLKMRLDIPERYLTKERSLFFLYANLLLVQLLVMPIFICAVIGSKIIKKHTSILKICGIINQNMQEIISRKSSETIMNKMIYYGAYEKRKSRDCMAQFVF